jgi:hypothetical protein
MIDTDHDIGSRTNQSWKKRTQTTPSLTLKVGQQKSEILNLLYMYKCVHNKKNYFKRNIIGRQNGKEKKINNYLNAT